MGGDTNKSSKFVIDVTVLGEVKKQNLTLRSSAKVGDLIFVTGKLGGALFSEKHLNFIPKLKQAQWLVNNFKINSMIDISDGLASDLGHIIRRSQVGAVIFEELIPISKSAKGIEGALADGEDFELLFTLSLKQAKRLLKRKTSRKVYLIGQIIKERVGILLVDKKNLAKRIHSFGFRHF